MGGIAGRVLLSLWLVCVGSAGLWAAESVELRYQVPDLLPIGETVRGQIEIIGELQQNLSLEAGDSDHFSVTINTNAQSRFRATNAKPVVSIEVLIRSLRAGRHQLPTITAVFRDGTRIASAPMSVEVLGPQEFLTGEVVSGLFFEPEVIVPGQSTDIVLRVYMRQDSGWAETRDGLPPPPEWAMAVGEARLSEGYVNDGSGQLWRVLTHRRRVTVDQPGNQILGGQVRLQRGDRFGRGETKSFVVTPATLIVKDISDLQRPADDRGLVSPLTMTADLERQRIAMGDGVRLSLTLRGRQAPLVIEMPNPQLSGLRFYAEEPRTLSDNERRFTWQVVPQRPGQFTIPSWGLPWLDPQTLRFERAETNPLSLEVLPGRQRALVPSDDDSELVGLMASSSSAMTPLAVASPRSWSPAVLWLVLLCSLVGSAASIALWRVRHWRPRAHRGRRLAQALRQGDLALANGLADQLIREVGPADQQAALRLALRGLEAARFGGQELSAADRQTLSTLETRP